MFRPIGRWAIAGIAVALAVSSPTVANAQGASHSSAVSRVATVSAFPSASSTVIGSVGFIDSDQCGYFWSVSRGDSVAESFSGPASVKKAILKLDVVTNALTAPNTVDWTLSINGKDVGSFSVIAGQSGPVTQKFKFKKIVDGTYDVKLRVTNEVPGGGGSMTLRYAGAGPHSITLKKK